MDRLIALITLRWRMDLRAVLGARERLLGLALALPGLLLFSGAASVVTYFGVRVLEARQPELVLPVLSALGTLLGLLWALSPLLAGVAFSETHDLTRLVHFPIPFPALVVSSLIANLMQPMVLAELPVVLVLSVALARDLRLLPLCLVGVGLGFLFVLAAAQVAGLLLHGLSRNRRLQDRALFVGLGLGFLLSLAPLVFIAGGGRALRPLGRWITHTDIFSLSPFAWGLRAAVHAGRGEATAFFFFVGAGTAAVLGAVTLSAALVGRIYRGELSLGRAPVRATAPSRMLLPGRLGALVEKDLRVMWRDPRLKAVLFTGLVGPLVLLLFVWQGTTGGTPASLLLVLATFTGISTFGSNAFALERRGLILLMGFPVERWRLLVAKNLGAALLRFPGVLLLVVASLLLGPAVLVAPVAVVALLTMLIGAGADNYVSILLPVAVPEPGRNPYGSASGGRGFGAAALSAALMFVALAVSAPFAFLAWLPLLLERPRLWLLSLPLALAGAVSVYGMMVAGASGLLAKREPELLARVLGEE